MTQSISVPPAGHASLTPLSSRDVLLSLLNSALATELLSLARSKRHYYAPELTSDDVREEYLSQAIEESMHTDRLVERIVELGGHPDFSSQRHADLSTVEPPKRGDMQQLIKEDVDAQRVAIESYRNIVRLLGPSDAATSAVFEDMIRRDQHFIERLVHHLGGNC